MSLKRLSVELIPRSTPSIQSDAALTREIFPVADTINIPDLSRFPLRSWQAAQEIPHYQRVIPHIRAIDIDPNAPLPGANTTLQEVLVIHGDPPQDASQKTFPNDSQTIIKRYRKELPHITVYAAFDPYRTSFWEELENVKSKKEAGAQGFFTQPFFDYHLFAFCYDLLENENIFWGMAPVIGEKSRAYWEKINHVVFPSSFKATLDGNIQLTRRILHTLCEAAGKAYLMPVKVKLQDFLPPLIEACR